LINILVYFFKRILEKKNFVFILKCPKRDSGHYPVADMKLHTQAIYNSLNKNVNINKSLMVKMDKFFHYASV